MSLPPGVTVAVLLSSRPEAFGLPLELLAGANGLDPTALRNDQLVLDPRLARTDAGNALRSESGWTAVDDADVDVTANRVTVTLHAKVNFTLLGIFVHGDPVEVDASASAEPREEP